MTGADPRGPGGASRAERGARCAIWVDGREVVAYEGESIAAALLAAGIRTFRVTDREHAPRSYYCGMGLCHDCLVTVDDQPNVRACSTRVRPALRVTTQAGVRLCGSAERGVPPSDERVATAVDLAIVGAGPAGMAAAVAAAECGVRPWLIDENADLGGQYWRQAPSTARVAGEAGGADVAKGRALMDRLRALGVELRLDTTVWGVFDGLTLGLARADSVIRVEQLLENAFDVR